MADAALLMGDDELAISFRGAKDPKAQVTVLADLNVCSPRKVADRLEALGLFEGTELRAEQFTDRFGERIPKRRRGSGKTGRVNQYPADRPSPGTPAIDELRAMELFREGLDDLAMAETLGCPIGRVVTWRKRMHLLRPRGGNMSAKKKGKGRGKPENKSGADRKTRRRRTCRDGSRADAANVRLRFYGGLHTTAHASGDVRAALHQRRAGAQRERDPRPLRRLRRACGGHFDGK